MTGSKRGFCKSNSSGSRLLPYSEIRHRTVRQRYVPSEKLRHPDLWQLNSFVMDMLTWVHTNCEECAAWWGALCAQMAQKASALLVLILYFEKKGGSVGAANLEICTKKDLTASVPVHLHQGPKTSTGQVGFTLSIRWDWKTLLAGCYSLHWTFYPPSVSLLDVVLQRFPLSYDGTRLLLLKLLDCGLLWASKKPASSRRAFKWSYDFFLLVLDLSS